MSKQEKKSPREFILRKGVYVRVHASEPIAASKVLRRSMKWYGRDKKLNAPGKKALARAAVQGRWKTKEKALAGADERKRRNSLFRGTREHRALFAPVTQDRARGARDRLIVRDDSIRVIDRKFIVINYLCI